MAERFKAPVLKTGEAAMSPWVRIPLPPPSTADCPLTRDTLAITAGYSYGGDKSHGARFGLAGEF